MLGISPISISISFTKQSKRCEKRREGMETDPELKRIHLRVYKSFKTLKLLSVLLWFRMRMVKDEDVQNASFH
jgi:hypothetical protein